MAAVNRTLDEIVSQYEKQVFFFGKEGCKYCDMLEEDMNTLSIPFTVLKLGDTINGVDQSVIEEVKEKYSYKTFPMLFFGKEFVGGYSSFQQLCYTSEIQNRLKSELGIEIRYNF